MRIYNKLSHDYDSLYKQGIAQFQEIMLQRTNGEDDYYVDFYPSLGIRQNETTDFIIYGQAVNGWRSGFNLKEKFDDQKLNNSIFGSNKFLETANHSPLDWVNVQWSNASYEAFLEESEKCTFYETHYKTCRSFFWNFTYKLISDYHSLDREAFDWAKKMVWSNLYKIAPDGENPDYFCRQQQQPAAAKLVAREIKELQPKFCIVVTNLHWWLPFRELLQTEVIPHHQDLDKIESTEKFGTTKIIVTQRPRFGKSERFVEQILSLIR